VSITTRGWGALVVGVACAALGWWTGLREPLTVAVALASFLLLGVAWVRVLDSGLRVRPQNAAAPVTVGEAATVVHRVRRTAGRSSPVVTLEVPVLIPGGATGELRSTVGGLHVGEETQLDALLHFPERGIAVIGPAAAGWTDPFGWFRRAETVGATTLRVVLPRCERLTLPEPNLALAALGDGRRGSSDRPSEEFSGLRTFVAGDDVRRVHWRSTARLGYPVVRTSEEARTPHLAVVLDHADERCEPGAFERAVTVAASLLGSAHAAGWTSSLHTATWTSPDVVDAAALNEALSHLAVIQPDADEALPESPSGAWAVRVWCHPPDRFDPYPSGLDVVCADDVDTSAIQFDGTTPLGTVWNVATARLSARPIPR
jgi:uncharacterized protein (DUF58 family)